MDIVTYRSLSTAALFVLFVALWIWAWSRKRKPDFDEAAQLPLGEDDRSRLDKTSKGEV